MSKDELIFMIKAIIGDGEDLQFLDQLDFTELKFVLSILEEKEEGERH